MRLRNKTAVITGSNQGLGRAIAEAFLQEGASVFLCARDAERLEKTGRELTTSISDGQKVRWKPCDVSKPSQVKSLFTAAVKAFGRIDVLVNNAGVPGPVGPSESVDWKEWIAAIETNLYGVFLPARAFIPHFKMNGGGKIINLSGGGATAPMPRFSAYAASKAAVVRLTETLAEELKNDHIDVNAIAPGALNTRFLDALLEAGPEAADEAHYKRALKQKETGGVPLTKGASLCVFLASDQSAGITGKLISAQWDPWPTLDRHVDELNASDIYTLRRIVPEDRHKKWD